MNYILLFGMPGGAELFFIVLVVIMLFGSKKIPELARGLGKGMREIKNATGDIQREIREGTKDITDLKDNIDIDRQVKDLLKKEPESKSPVPFDEEVKNEESVPEIKTVQRKNPYESADSENAEGKQ